jgi:hypothetical protein
VGDRDSAGTRPFARELGIWRDLAGGTRSDGSPVVKPAELGTAELVITLCDRWHVLPSQVMNEPAHLLRMLDVYELGHREEEEGGE